ncbi:PhzF family phenazine biosynthesis protein [Sorangium sp. So ce726]|uniref:PhzF family phenazine biosynthesis protein n=1 Tax=Sorangium sp. So ce726 TaxID=3133319 RepID=UPI003F611682
MRALPYRIVDVFTDRPFAGNPLAVFTDAARLDAATMQTLAREMNLSESAFVLPPTSPETHARIRIFTPTMELPFAGHPTLGTAFVLAEPWTGSASLIRLETQRGVSDVRLSRDDRGLGFGWMTQPLPLIARFEPAREVLAALGAKEPASPIELYDNGPHYVLVELGGPDVVAALRPDMQRLAALGSIAVTAFARHGERWKCRVFAPGEGIPEDPATGAAAGPLALHLARHGRTPFGAEVVIEQGVELARPSTLHARVIGSADRLERVEVGGNAVIVARGAFELEF